MAKVVDLASARAGRADRARHATEGLRGDIAIYPLIIAKHGWLRREALRIAAHVNGASTYNIRRILRLEAERAGLNGPAVDVEIERAIAFVEAVADAARAIAAPSGPGKFGGAA